MTIPAGSVRWRIGYTPIGLSYIDSIAVDVSGGATGGDAAICAAIGSDAEISDVTGSDTAVMAVIGGDSDEA
jgi:hypothetical protein